MTKNATDAMFEKDSKDFNETEFSEDKAFIKTLFYSRIWIPFFVLNWVMGLCIALFMLYKAKVAILFFYLIIIIINFTFPFY